MEFKINIQKFDTWLGCDIYRLREGSFSLARGGNKVLIEGVPWRSGNINTGYSIRRKYICCYWRHRGQIVSAQTIDGCDSKDGVMERWDVIRK